MLSVMVQYTAEQLAAFRGLRISYKDLSEARLLRNTEDQREYDLYPAVVGAHRRATGAGIAAEVLKRIAATWERKTQIAFRRPVSGH